MFFLLVLCTFVGTITAKDFTSNWNVNNNNYVSNINVGDTMIWTWNGNHSVTATNGEFDSGELSDGTFNFTFMTVGSFPYYCKVTGHQMSGTVIVTDSDNLSTGAIIGIVVGVIVVLGAIVILIFKSHKNKSTQKQLLDGFI